jgi:hypothetical protein
MRNREPAFFFFCSGNTFRSVGEELPDDLYDPTQRDIQIMRIHASQQAYVSVLSQHAPARQVNKVN